LGGTGLLLHFLLDGISYGKIEESKVDIEYIYILNLVDYNNEPEFQAGRDLMYNPQS
jgi:hypothetical protein